MEDLISRTMGPQIAVEVVGSAGLWPTKVDAPQLESALLNLCINARDAMPDGGRLTIETANKWLDDRAARERELPPGQYLSLCVTDTGTGMPPDVVAKAFDPFFTTKPLGKGTGLGLSMIYGFVRQSGGQVRAYSEVGKGTTMCIYLPRHTGVVDDDAAPEEAAVERGFGETVLVVDDEPNVRMLVSEVLTEQHYRNLEAKDGRSAFAILELGKRIDLMITDVGLPGGQKVATSPTVPGFCAPNEDTLHHGIRGERSDFESPGAGNVCAGEAVCHVDAGEQGARDNRAQIGSASTIKAKKAAAETASEASAKPHASRLRRGRALGKTSPIEVSAFDRSRRCVRRDLGAG